jgi:hypothetical protein
MEKRPDASAAREQAHERPRHEHEQRAWCDVENRERSPRDGGLVTDELPIDGGTNEDGVVGDRDRGYGEYAEPETKDGSIFSWDRVPLQ